MNNHQARKPAHGRTEAGSPLSSKTVAWLRVLTMVALLSSGVSAAHATTVGISVALQPQGGGTVTGGSDVYIDVQVTGPSEGFNVWQSTFTFNPAALTYVPESPPSKQQGCLMTGSCSNSCGNLYLQIKPGPDSVFVFDGLLCAQTFVTQAGKLFTLHFHASNTSQQTQVSFRDPAFYSGSHLLAPIATTNTQITILGSTAVDPTSPASGLHLSATPNPSRGAVTFALTAEQSGEQAVVVHDVLGRSVRVLSRGWQTAGSRQLVWDGTDDSGSRAAPGVYLATLRVGNRQTQSRITLLK